MTYHYYTTNCNIDLSRIIIGVYWLLTFYRLKTHYSIVCEYKSKLVLESFPIMDLTYIIMQITYNCANFLAISSNFHKIRPSPCAPSRPLSEAVDATQEKNENDC